nr:hypothetical protein CFP56_66892 [Quercus suber]
MGIEDDGVGMKRRVRAPLNEILDNGMRGKRSRVEGEVLTLSKLMAPQLGAAAAVRQPCCTGNKKWRFTGIYCNLETSKREESWKLLEQLSRSCDLPWVCMGDFNEIMHSGEKEGGSARPNG